MKQALALAALLIALSSGFAMADKPASVETEFPVISPEENSGNSLPVLAEAGQPPAKVPASRAARAEWQRRLEQRRLEMQRRGRGPAPDDQARRDKTVESKKKRARRNKKSRRKEESTKPSLEKRNDASKSKRKSSKKPAPQEKPQPKPASGKPKTRIKSDRKSPTKEAKKDASVDLPIIMPMAVRVPSYGAMRATIPFSRSEWEADPSYRHNGTMELMLGQLRDMVVYRYPPMNGPMAPGSGVTINNGGGSQFPNSGYGGFGGAPFGFNPGLNGVIPARGIINSFQTQGFIGRNPLPDVPPAPAP